MKNIVEVLAIYVSSGHNFRGRHGKPAGTNPVVERESASCVVGKGIEGDRYFGVEVDYKAQVTVFDQDIHEKVLEEFGTGHSANKYRRNVLLSGVDLNMLIGKQFTIGEVTFEGIEECEPCHWLNGAIAPGVENYLKGRGGLRAKIVQSGILKVGRVELKVL